MRICILIIATICTYARACQVTIWVEKKNDCAAGNGVYDLTGYDDTHPGGKLEITNACGKEVQDGWRDKGGHEAYVDRIKSGKDINVGTRLQFLGRAPGCATDSPTDSPTTEPAIVDGGVDIRKRIAGAEENKKCFQPDHCLEWKINKIAGTIDLTMTARDGYVSVGFNVNGVLSMSPADVVACWEDEKGPQIREYANVNRDSKPTEVGLYKLSQLEKSGGLLKCTVTRKLIVPADVRCKAGGENKKQDINDEELAVIFAWGPQPETEIPLHTGRDSAKINLYTGAGSTGISDFGYTLILASVLWIALLLYGLVVRIVTSRNHWLRHRCIGSKIHNAPKSCLRNIALSQAIALVLILVYLIALPPILTGVTGRFEGLFPSTTTDTTTDTTTGTTDCDAEKLGDVYRKPDSFSQFWRVLYGTGAATSIFLSLALFPVSRYSVLYCFLGLPFERMVEMHRWASRAAIISGFLHGLIHFLNSVVDDSLNTIFGNPINLAGVACLVVMILMAILALEPIRRKCFEVFVYPHQFLALIAVVLAMIHGKELVNVAILLLPLLWYLIDQGVRIYFALRPFKIQRMQALPGGVTKVTVKGKLEHEPGQYCWLMFPTISRLQYHPFSISTGAGDTKADNFTFHIKNMGPGTFTHALNKLAPAYDRAEKDAKLVGNGDLAVVGPYGKLGLNVMDYSVLILIAGGIGVTPMASILHWMLNMSDQHKLRDIMPHLTLVVFVWSARGDQPFDHWFPELLERAKANPFVQLVLHNTRKTQDTDAESARVEKDSDEESEEETHKIYAGRPNLQKLIDTNMSRDPRIGTAVFACGPEPMILSAQAAASKCGADFHKETFLF